MKNTSNVLKWTLLIIFTMLLGFVLGGVGGLIPNHLAGYVKSAFISFVLLVSGILGIVLIMRVIQLIKNGKIRDNQPMKNDELRDARPIKKERKLMKQKAGILLIIIGIFIPSIFYPFLTVNHKERLINTFAQSQRISYPLTFRALEIVLVEGKYIAKKKVWKGRSVLPYPYIVAFGIILAFTGITILALSYKKKDATKTDEHGA